MPESVPESRRWTERAQEREAERAKLEEKRRKVRSAMAPGVAISGHALTDMASDPSIQRDVQAIAPQLGATELDGSAGSG